MATGKSNYVAWKFRVLRILKEKGLAGALEDDSADDASTDQESRDRKNDQAFTIISLNIRDSQIPHIQASSNAKEAWEALAKVHQGIGSNGRMVLMQKLWGLHLSEGQDMSAHLNSFKELSTQVANLSPDGVGIPDSDLVSMLSLSLPQSYEPLIMAVQSRADNITFDFLSGRLLQEATRRQAARSTTTEQNDQPLSAFSARSSFRPNGGTSGRGHSRWGNRGFGRGTRGGFSGRGRGGTGQGMVSGRCHYCKKEGHWKNECFKRKSDLQKNSGEGHLAFVGLANPDIGRKDWIIDSGASRHLTARRELLDDYISIRPTSITIGNGKEITAVGQGNLSLRTNTGIVSLLGVLNVPEIGSNLLSVASIVDHGFTVEFTKECCVVSKHNTASVIGKRQGNIYLLSEIEETALAGLSHRKDQTTRETWHKRIGHRSLNRQAVKQIAQSVTGFDLPELDKGVEGLCGICAEGKQTREYLTGEREKSEELLNTIHSDVCGPMAATGLMGERYFTTFIDESSGRIAISLLAQKSDVFSRFVEYKAKVERETGKKIKSVRCDGGGEYTGNTFRRYLAENGITQRITPPYTPEHNGIAERANRTIMDMVRCMMFDSGLGKEFWGFAALTAVHIINRLPSSSHEYKTPFEKWFGSPPSIGHLRVFGCIAYRQVPTATRRKLDPRAQKCRLIGYKEESGSRIYRVYDLDTKQVLITRDIVFDEKSTGVTLGKESGTRSQNTCESLSESSEDTLEGELAQGERESEDIPQISTEVEDQEEMAEPLPPIDPAEDHGNSETYDQDTIVLQAPTIQKDYDGQPTPFSSNSTALQRPKRTGHAREMFRPAAWQAFMAVTDDPDTLQQALTGEHAVQWEDAWKSELESLRKNGTWVIEKAPVDKNIVGCRWLFQRKDDGRFKVRLVAKGYSQQPGIDFQETFAPVAKFTTLRLLLALVAENDWELHSMDVKTAFLNGVLEEEVYMECPEGVFTETTAGTVCRLIKAIYGLKQSPRAWYRKIHTFFIEHDFIRSTQDYSLYINYDRKVLVLVYVDDLVLAAANVKDISWIKASLTKAFEMTDLGELTTFLGLQVSRDRSKRLLSLYQEKYIDKILCRHGMQDARPSLTPLDPNMRFSPKTQHQIEETGTKEVSLELYQSAVGSLMYAMLGTRPDIAYAVGLVSQFNHSPQWEHWIAVKRIFRYLVGTKTYALRYGTSNSSGGYSDADWGSGQDRKSVGGFVFLLNGSAISWSSKKQTSIALSTTEAEYMAMTQATKEIVWLRVLLEELGALAHITQMSQLYGDNQGALALARNPEYHARTKHIDIQYHFVRELVMVEKVFLNYCPSSDMIADIMTKSLPRTSHEKHTMAMGMIERNGERNGTLREGGC